MALVLTACAGVGFSQCSSDKGQSTGSGDWEQGEDTPDNLSGEGGIDEGDNNISARIAAGDDGDGAFD